MKKKASAVLASKPAYTPPQRDQHADGLRIRAMIDANRPEHRAAIALLYEECPHKVGFNSSNGKYEGPVTSSNVAAWAMKMDTVCNRLKKVGLL